MKIKLLSLVLLFTTLAIQAQRKPKIKGNRTVIEVKDALPPFTKIELRDDLEITLRRSTEEAYTVLADDNLIDVLKFKIEDNTLVISSFYQIVSKKKLDIEIAYTQLSSIMLSDGRLTSIDKISSENLKITTLGSAKIEIGADAGLVKIDMQDNSSGSFNLTTDSLSVKLLNKADASIYTNSYNNALSMNDNSRLEIEGTADNFEISLDGNANLRAEDLESQKITATLMASSDARFFVTEAIKLSQQGSSRCYLYGEPAIELRQFTDTAELFKRKK
ncbi:MAG: DUF2807 domain-containing protein [Eudoraea sp.]|nr:DUF2807 domain-containing protein [Eudoraea sp.]